MGMIPKYSDFQKLTDEELIERYEKETEHTVVGTGFYLEELSRRSLQRQSERMLDFTNQIRTWTLVIVVLTLINAVFVAVSVFG
jgi:signal transduction histidine kinase